MSAFLLCIIAASALLVAKDLFHLSFPNLLRTIFGGGKKGSSVVAVCPSKKNLDGNQLAVEKLKLNKSLIEIESLDLNRTALAFNKSLTDDDEIISFGFLWNNEDAMTTKYRPQGITTFHSSSGRRFVLVSWYGRKDEGYSNRGGRISFVDISQMQQNTTSFPYCHVLLVDEHFCSLPKIHVGGIEQQNGTLYVADSRKGMQSILEFDIVSGLHEVPPEMMNSMFGYRYVLRQSSSFHSPTKPSYISYDIDNHKFVVGTYARCGKRIGVHVDSEKCFNQPENRLVWFDKNDVNLNHSADSNVTDTRCHYFSEMQGAVSARVGNNTLVWVSSSYGPIGDSHLHLVNASSSECPQMSLDGSVLDEVAVLRYPPGLEDLHIERMKEMRYMWMTIEFGTRRVFATPLDNLLPLRD
ncbi:hypothetical protein ACHAXR_010545 [Thalassiosira sp. AJA248-18]